MKDRKRRDHRQRRKRKKQMPHTLDNLLADIRNRSTAGGIVTAAAYSKSLADCLAGGGLCPVDLFQAKSAELWAKELADAAERLTYAVGTELLEKSLQEGTGLKAGSVLEYDCVLSSRRKDRDGDILEQAGGLVLDTKMPLLWQHIQVQPIGTLVKVLSQDEHSTKCRFALADIPLGRDAATLVKMGALRKSHGFKPLDFEPVEIVKGRDGQDYVKGWHIKRSECMEGSLVSIPANADTGILATYEKEFDGICTAFSRGQLHTDAVKHWAKSLHDKRPVVVPGATLATKADCTCGTKSATPPAAKGHQSLTCPKCETKFDIHTADGVDLSKTSCPMCGAAMDGGKSAAPVVTKSLTLKAVDLDTKAIEHHIPGSFEWIREKLDDSAGRYLRDKNLVSEYDGYAWVYATLPTMAIVCTGYSTGRKCFRIDWAMDGDTPKFTGDPAEVNVQPAVIDKRIADIRTKSASLTPPVEPKSTKQLARELIARCSLEEGDAGLKVVREVSEQTGRVAEALDSQLNPSPLAALGL
jgi:HK97 family phage prohead protease